jgi:hypothetical protein
MSSEFPSNRIKDKKGGPLDPVVKEEPKVVERVVQSDVVRRKKPLGKRLAETFVGGDAKGVWGFVTLDVLVPAAKDMFADAVSQGVERMIYGEARSTGRRSGRHPGDPRVSYNRYSSPSTTTRAGNTQRGGPQQELSRRARSSHDFDEVILPTRVEADEVIERLFDLVSQYEVATVGDLYDLLGVTGSYTDAKWGWFDLRGAGVTRVRHGYLLDLPKPEPLD